MRVLEEMPYIKKFICCLSQRTGCILVGFTGFFAYLIVIIIYIKQLVNTKGGFDIENYRHWGIVYYGAQSFLATILLVAVFQKSSLVLATFLWLQLVLSTGVLGVVAFLFFTAPKVSLVVLIYYLMCMYFWICISSHYQELTGSYALHMAPKAVKA